MEHPLIYLTADNVICSLGFSTNACWEQMLRRQSGVRLQKDQSLFENPFFASRISDEKLRILVTQNNLHAFTRFEQLLILTLKQTIEKAALKTFSSDTGFILASTKGNIRLLSNENENDKIFLLFHLAQKIARYLGFSTRPLVVCNACISGVSAMVVAKRLIDAGVYKQILVAGGDELSRFITTGFHAFKSVSPQICKPYDVSRDGLSLGEAFGSLLLTTDKNLVPEAAKITLAGGSVSNDANHISGPSRTGEELHNAIEQALKQAGLLPHEVSFVNAHGTATIYNDEMESRALRLSRLDSVPLQSLKSYLGHTLGASGVVETIFCKKQMEENSMLGTLNFEKTGLPFQMNIASEHRQMRLRSCLKTASGFGGCNSAIVIGKDFPNRKSTFPQRDVKISHYCKTDASGIEVDGEKIIENISRDDFSVLIRKAFSALDMDYRKFYKMDDLSKLGFVTVEYLARTVRHFEKLRPESKGIVSANRSASLDTDIRYRRNLDEVGDCEASPAIFVYTLPNVMHGEVCIRLKIKGENTFFIQDEFDKDFLIKYARIVMNEQDMEYCLVGWCDLLRDIYRAEYYLLKRD